MRTIRFSAHRAVLKAVGSALALALSVVSPTSAQYFGQNKVQYKNLDFKVLKTDNFDIYFYPSERPGIDIAARLAERWRARLGRLLGHELRGRQPLILYASHTDFEQTNAIPGDLGEGTGGVTEPLRRRIVLPLAGPVADTDHVIGHELVHAFQFDITANPNGPAGQNGAERLPLWFIEGMAEYFSLGPVDPNTAMWLRDAAEQNKLPSISDLDNPKYFPYRWGQAFWAYVGGRFGDPVIGQMLRVAAAAGDTNVAIQKVLGLNPKELSSDWQAAIRSAYAPVLAAASPIGDAGRVVVKGTQLADLNVGPSISPDGRRLAYLSSRSMLSIDLYVADAANGRTIHKLTSTATDPHYSSIQFIYSAGAWDSSGKRIAIATVTSGHAALAIFNADAGSKEREVTIPEVDEVINPTWAPDGHAIGFTGMVGGLTDLFVYDLTASKLLRLTDDAFADLEPAWSPDGRRIAFATDRFSSRLDTLDFGPLRLGIVDLSSGQIEQVGAFTAGKNINPQWTPDGRSLYFISDRDGIPNLYRIALETGDVRQITSVATGLSGITNTSPVLSVAATTGVASFSVYQSGKYDIYTLDASARSVPPRAASMAAAILPPIDRRPSAVSAALADATTGLPAPSDYEIADYSPKLSLEGLAQPMVGVGVSRYGSSIGGGVALSFGDMLGNQNLMTALQLNTGLTNSFDAKDLAGQVGYFNQAHRLNWGLIGGQVPYLSGGFGTTIGLTPQGDVVENDQLLIFRQTEQSLSGIAAYPFDRARRVELQGGVTRVSFDQITQTTSYSLVTGAVLGVNTTTTPLARALTMATSSAAFVSDTSNFGATSPVQGQRYRIEASPTFGTINFTGILADYRRYFMPASFYTVAVRAMHYGRYGPGGADPRLFPIYIGYPGLVRGYDVSSFDATDCPPTASGSCPALDRLLGSRSLVGNLEFRFPLLRPFGVSQRMYGPIPVELALFADGGIAWNGLKQSLTIPSLGAAVAHPFLLRDGVSSAGVAVRVNLFGYAVGEFDYVRPFERPAQGWLFQFNLLPGF